MRKLLCIVGLLALSMPAFAQTKYVQASDLTLVGKIMPTPNPYHRVDTVRFKGFTDKENRQVRMSAGIAVAFQTNAKDLSVRAQYDYLDYPNNTMGISARGFDLYIKEKGQWLWAGCSRPAIDNESGTAQSLVKNLEQGTKECLLYFPLLSEFSSVEIGVNEEAEIAPLAPPFRHRVGVFGSSFTHGTSTSRAGMTWPAQFTRHTGIQLLSLGCSGNAKLQPYFADVLAAAQVDAFLFDAFSNPGIDQIKERLFPFIEKIQAKHPHTPLIFQRTIYRETSNFNTLNRDNEAKRIKVVDSLMALAVKKYPHVYYIHPNATCPRHETSVDGVHPGDYGYTLWAESIEKAVCKILKKYDLK